MRAAEIGTLWQAATIVKVGGQHFKLEINQRFEKTGLDMRAFIGDAAPHQRCKNALCRSSPRQHIGNRQTEWHRSLPFITIEPHEARARLRQ
ncbi:hypothetical protein D9M69_713330 [compost metagenome]